MSSGDKRPRGPKPVTKIELTDNQKTLRIILLIGCIVVAVISLTVALTSALNTDPGWKVVEVTTQELNCSRDFALNYYLGDAGVSATVEYKRLLSVYQDAVVKGFWLFDESLLKDGMVNVAYLNGHLNEMVTVDVVLYEAFAQIQQAGNRCLYLGPVYLEYDRIFRSESDTEAAGYDPVTNPEQAKYLQEIAAFAMDPKHIDVELLGNNQVRLKVSSEYLAYIQENELENLLDFGWMKNAFVIDYLADTLLENGFNKGYLLSYDGYTRNLDNRGIQYSFNLFDRIGNDIHMPAVLQYAKPVSVVYLRNYPMTDRDVCYGYSNGRIVTDQVDPVDGLSKSALNNLVSYSYDKGCAEILLEMIPVYLQDSFAQEKLKPMAEMGIFSIWFRERILCYNDKDAMLKLDHEQTVSYEAQFVN